jgi:hypothetical protein
MDVAFRIRAIVGVVLCGIIAGACGRSPTAPSQSRTATQPSIFESMTALDSPVTTQAAGLSAGELAARGWDCQPAPGNPTRFTCSPPNQMHPILLSGPPPPEDRPATFTLLVFDNGVFAGTDLLIRSDLYRGQECRATNAPYRFIARIGYYECVHQSQAD